MKCPYCYRRTNDMPNHLIKNPKCHSKHKDILRSEFIFSLKEKMNVDPKLLTKEEKQRRIKEHARKYWG